MTEDFIDTMEAFYLAILAGLNPPKEGMPTTLMLEYLEKDFRDIITVHDYLDDKENVFYVENFLHVFYDILEKYNLNKYRNINDLGKFLESSTLHIYKINICNYNVLLYLAMNFKIRFIIYVENPEIYEHPNIMYVVSNEIINTAHTRYLYDILPRE